MKDFLKKHRITAIVGLIALIIGVSFGRYATPEKVVIKTKEVEVEKIVVVEKKVLVKEEVKKTAKRKNISTKKVTKPDGTIIEETNESEEDVTFADTKEKEGSEVLTEKEAIKTTKAERETKFDTKRLKVSALVGVETDKVGGKSGLLKDPPMIYGIHASYSFFGPISVGAFGLTSKEFGISIGIQF